MSFAERLHKDTPLIGEDFSLMAYPPEFIFAEKFQTAIILGGANSRMRDFYDLLHLVDANVMNIAKLKEAVQQTFKKSNTDQTNIITFSNEEMDDLSTLWSTFLENNPLLEAPKSLLNALQQSTLQ